MSLGKEQRKFTPMVAMLILYAYQRGYELSFDDAYATEGHMEGSLHYSRLAIDLNLFKEDVYLTETSDHEFLGEFWESIGGSWGGRFSNPDGNHYSLEYQGRR